MNMNMNTGMEEEEEIKLKLQCGECGTLFETIKQAENHVRLYLHTNFTESSQPIKDLACLSCQLLCNSDKAWELHKLRSGHTEVEDRHAKRIAEAVAKFYAEIARRREEEEEKLKKAKETIMSILQAAKADVLRDQMRECLESIKQNLKVDRAEKALNTLFTLVKNVAIKPDEEKFRKININNMKFQENIGHLQAGVTFLELCKFTRRDRVLFLPRDEVEMEVLHTAGSELNKALGKY